MRKTGERPERGPTLLEPLRAPDGTLRRGLRFCYTRGRAPGAAGAGARMSTAASGAYLGAAPPRGRGAGTWTPSWARRPARMPRRMAGS